MPTKPARPRLSFELLEDRSVPAVVLAPISATQVSTTAPTYIPVTVTNTPAGAVTTTATSDNPNLAVSVIAPGRSVRFDVAGKTAAGDAYTGSLTLRLFDDAAPLAAQRIVDLANSGFYNNKLFHRVIPDFVIQGGSPTGTGVGGSSLPDFADEFSANYTFASNGILAMANAGDDNNNSQFFVTALNEPLSARAEFLNFNHSILGVLTEGFDTYQNTITTPRNASNDRPLTDVVITSATVFNDRENAVLRLTPRAGFAGAANVAVSSTDGTGAPFAESFAATATASTNNSRAFLNNPAPLSTPANTPLTVQFSGTDLERDALTFAVRDANFSGAPAGVTVSVNASTGLATFTPPADFVGTVQFKVGARDQTNRAGSAGLDAAPNYDTQLVTLTVTVPVRLNTPTTAVAGQPARLTATVGPLQAGSAGGSVTFRTPNQVLGTAPVVNGVATLDANFTGNGTVQVAATFVPTNPGEVGGEAVPATVAVVPEVPPQPPVVPPVVVPPVVVPPVVPTTPPVVSVAGASAGSAPTVSVTVNGVTTTFAAYEVTFTGGVRAASADVTGDGVPDIVVTPGVGGGPLVKVFDLAGNLLYSNMIFEESFRGGLNLALGDSANLGYAQITVGAGAGGGPRVSVIDAKDRTVLQNYFAGDPGERGGVNVSLVPDSAAPTKLNLVAQTPTATNTYTGSTGQPVSTTGATSPPAPVSTATASGSARPSASLRDMLASTAMSDPAAV